MSACALFLAAMTKVLYLQGSMYIRLCFHFKLLFPRMSEKFYFALYVFNNNSSFCNSPIFARKRKFY